MSQQENTGCIALIAIVIVGFIVIIYWQLLLTAIILGILFYILFRYCFIAFFLSAKLEKIKTSNLILIYDKTNYFIPLNVFDNWNKINKGFFNRFPIIKNKEITVIINDIMYKMIHSMKWKVEYILPEIQENDLVFHYFQCDLNEVKFINTQRQLRDLDYQSMAQVSEPIKILKLQIEPQISEFHKQLNELDKLEKLALSSEVFAGRVEWFKRAKIQIQNLIDETKKIENQSLKFIRETLIGQKLAQFDPENLPDINNWTLTIGSHFNDIQDKYQTLKVEINTYDSLTNEL
ncbi:hypothetical protein IQ215_11735 [Cyanobacterium stanieri LEGE 03274]|uniref:Band 7 domain-containing protein n=1 Tax=Cyanobacterium stanieri LEGE 03274 TaxID=1828756 RepID=A0ABR9V658_9CHRO|nr:hypothetical protein [Cyanobacterium stanieri]MBE9223368.1 hypothetical protein [Cyanobacterium stanieri LEGE 03274]